MNLETTQVLKGAIVLAGIANWMLTTTSQENWQLGQILRSFLSHADVLDGQFHIQKVLRVAELVANVLKSERASPEKLPAAAI
jgi:hypothetical protein